MSPNSEPSMPSRKTATAGKKKNCELDINIQIKFIYVHTQICKEGFIKKVIFPAKFMDASRGLNLTRTAINSSDSGNKINKYVIWLQ